MLQGCANRVLGGDVNASTIRVLNRHGIEVVTPPGEGCCGALVHHMGREHEAHAQAKINIDLWTQEMDGEGLDAIVVNVSGCGTNVKDYGFMLRTDPAYADRRPGYRPSPRTSANISRCCRPPSRSGRQG